MYVEVVSWLSHEARLILGINCAYHESAAALVRDGEVIFAVEEERFTRTKHAKAARVSNPDQLPWNAIRACLEFAPDARLCELDAIAYSLEPGQSTCAGRRRSLRARRPGRIRNGARRRGIQHASPGVPQILARAGGDDSLIDRFHVRAPSSRTCRERVYASPFQRSGRSGGGWDR